MFAYVGRGNALPHSSDRNGGGGDGVGTGSRRGGEGVTTGGSAVGAARLYNLRLPPKASGKDTGLVAGARIEGLPPMPPTPLLEVLSIFQKKICFAASCQFKGEVVKVTRT